MRSSKKVPPAACPGVSVIGGPTFLWGEGGKSGLLDVLAPTEEDMVPSYVLSNLNAMV